MAVTFPFVTALLCEKVLTEPGGVHSAIRIVDIFQIAADAPPETVVQFFALISLKTVPVPDAKVRVRVSLVGPSGKREQLPDPPDQPYGLPLFEGDKSIPSGLSMVFQINVKPTNFGTGYVEIEVDGQLAVRIPFTIRKLPPLQLESKS
jgi:hypothetical protein